jgi:hypothetical protein
MTKIHAGVAGFAPFAFGGLAQAATVSCPPNPLPVGLDRRVTVTAAA